MTEKQPPSNETSSSDTRKRSQIKQLFGLCEAWVVGGVEDHDFASETLQLRKDLLNADWNVGQGGEKGRLLRQFNLAVQCVLAIDQTIGDLRLLARTRNPPVAMRAFYFGKRVTNEAVLQLESVLRLDG